MSCLAIHLTGRVQILVVIRRDKVAGWATTKRTATLRRKTPILAPTLVIERVKLGLYLADARRVLSTDLGDAEHPPHLGLGRVEGQSTTIRRWASSYRLVPAYAPPR